MTEHGNEISDVTVEQVRDHLAEETDPKSIERLTAARESLAGPIQFLQALQSRFGEEIVVLDTGSYFTANKVREFAEGTERELLYLSTGMAKLDPTEVCWRQLRTALGNGYSGSLDELRAGIRLALETINPPGIYQYLCR